MCCTFISGWHRYLEYMHTVQINVNVVQWWILHLHAFLINLKDSQGVGGLIGFYVCAFLVQMQLPYLFLQGQTEMSLEDNWHGMLITVVIMAALIGLLLTSGIICCFFVLSFIIMTASSSVSAFLICSISFISLSISPLTFNFKFFSEGFSYFFCFPSSVGMLL